MSAQGLRAAPRASSEACSSSRAVGHAEQSGCAAIRGLMIDVPDVLYDATLWRRWLVRLVNRLGVRAEFPGFFRVWDEHYLRAVCCGRRDFGEAFQSFLLAAGLSWAQVDEIDAASRIQRQNLDQNVRPLPGVAKTMGRLAAAGLPLVAWIDTPLSAADLEARLQRVAGESQFQAVLSSCDLECSQPSPECYARALEALDLPASETAYLGHDARHLAAASAAGLRTIAFNFEAHAVADVYLTRFEELTESLAHWPSQPTATCMTSPRVNSAATQLTEGVCP